MFQRSSLNRESLTMSSMEASMFADKLEPSWTERGRRRFTTLTSFGIQAIIVSILAVLPLLRPAGLPSMRQLSTPISLGRPLGDVAVTRAHAPSNSISIVPAENVFRFPTHLSTPAVPSNEEGPPQIAGSGIPGALLGGNPHGVPGLLEPGPQPVPPAPPAAIPHTIRLSHMSPGDLIRKVQPAYPALARSARIQGAVVLQATISTQGAIENLKVLSGHPILVPAALEAVRQWRYRPYILNNQPVEVETQVTVNFSLAGN